MYRPTVRPNGIEGDDLPFHLKLLRHSADDLPKDVYFWPLVDHYNMHDDQWYDTNMIRAEKYRTVVFYDLVHLGDHEASIYRKFVDDFPHDNKIYLTNNLLTYCGKATYRTMMYDFMWNRFKAYYTESIPENLHLHHYAGPGRYHIPDLDFDRTRSKKFMSLTGREWGYRSNLYEIIRQYSDQGYTSNRSRGIYLEDQPVMGIFTPVPGHFYQDSYLSIYVESNWRNLNLIHITEKTYDPLIKGHAILPLSNPETIKHIERAGFLLPPFIDYSFDRETDLDHRLKLILNQFEYLLQQDLPTLFRQCRDIFEHNQRCIHNIGYDHRLLELYHV